MTGCDTEIRESRTELHWTDGDGEEHPYEPPRYDVDYDLFVTIHVNTQYFDEITFKINDYRVENRMSVEFRKAERQADEIRDALTAARQGVRNKAARAAKQNATHTCPFCGATTIPDASGRCEYCDGAMDA